MTDPAKPIDAPKPRSRAELVLKWVAGITAVLSLIGGTFTVMRLLSDVWERERFIAETFDIGQRQQGVGDYAAAWASFEAALKSADEGGQFAKLIGRLSEPRQKLRMAQAELAMVWLRDIGAPEGRKFSDVVDKLLPVLERGAAMSSGARSAEMRADLLAHIGWAYFLKQRDSGGSGNFDPASQYRAALAIDPANPYAHAHWGHWILWKRENVPEAIGHFEVAAHSKRARTYARMLHLAALRNLGDEQGSAETIRLVDQMRRNGEPLTPTVVKNVETIYYLMVMHGEIPAQVSTTIPPKEQIDLLRVLFESAHDGSRNDAARSRVRDAAVAMLLETDGQRVPALLAWRTLRATVRIDGVDDSTLRSRADAAIKRLTVKSSSRAG